MCRPAFNIILKIFLGFSLFVLASCTSNTEIKQEKAEIAILMPLSNNMANNASNNSDQSAQISKGETQGRKLAELVKLGLDDHLKGMVSTTTYDVSTLEYTNQAIKKMAAKRTQIILGPLFSPSVQAIEKFAEENDIVILTLSNNALLAKDKSIYVLGHAPLKQTSILIKYLAENNYKEMAVVMPRSKTSANLTKAIGEIARSNGARVFTSLAYNQSNEEIKESIARLSVDVDNMLEDSSTEGKPVILIAEENQDNLRVIFQEIEALNLDKKAIIAGDARLDIPYDGDIRLIFTGGSRVASGSLLDEVKRSLGVSHLNYLENVAYDTGAIAADAINLSYSRESFVSKLSSPLWFKGLSGDIRFIGGVAERKYSIVRKTGSKYEILQ